MPDDCFDDFRRALRRKRGNKPPTLKSQSLAFERDFPTVVDAVGKMRSILAEEQPTSNIAHTMPEYNQEDNSLFINIRGERDSRIASVLIFSYQNGSVHALNNSFKEANADSDCSWGNSEQDDLVRRIVQHFRVFFSK